MAVVQQVKSKVGTLAAAAKKGLKSRQENCRVLVLVLVLGLAAAVKYSTLSAQHGNQKCYNFSN